MVCAITKVALSALLLPIAANAQVQRDGSVDEEISVSLVTVDVYVTDKKGRPVEGLTLDDFVIREERQPVDVESFRAMRSQGSQAGVDGLTQSETPLTVALFIDESLLLPTDWARVDDGLKEFIAESVPKGTGFVLARHSENLEVLVPFSRSKELIDQRLEETTPGNGAIGNRQAADRAIEMITLESELLSSRVNARIGTGDLCTDSFGPAVEAGRAFAAEASDRFARSTESLARFISSLSGIPGRKAVVYVSGGLQMQPGSEIFYALADTCPERQSEVASLIQEYQQSSTLNGLSAHANANRVTLYPLDASGVSSSASESQTVFNTVASLKDSLVLLGRETGGRAILNSGNPTDALAELGTDFHKYYEVTYRPNRPVQRSNYLIDVRLENPGKRNVRYRRTVAGKTTEEVLGERLMSTLLLGAEDNPLDATVALQEPSVIDRKTVRQPILVQVPRSRLLLLDGEVVPPQGLRLFLVARDSKNRGSDVREYTVQPQEMDGDSEILRYVINIDLEPGDYQIAVGIRDERARRASYLRVAANLSVDDGPTEQTDANQSEQRRE